MTEIISVLAGILKTSVVTIYKTIDTTIDTIKGVLASIRPTSFVTMQNNIQQDKVNYAVSEREGRVTDVTMLTRMTGCTGIYWTATGL